MSGRDRAEVTDSWQGLTDEDVGKGPLDRRQPRQPGELGEVLLDLGAPEVVRADVGHRCRTDAGELVVEHRAGVPHDLVTPLDQALSERDRVDGVSWDGGAGEQEGTHAGVPSS